MKKYLSHRGKEGLKETKTTATKRKKASNKATTSTGINVGASISPDSNKPNVEEGISVQEVTQFIDDTAETI